MLTYPAKKKRKERKKERKKKRKREKEIQLHVDILKWKEVVNIKHIMTSHEIPLPSPLNILINTFSLFWDLDDVW